MSLRYRSFQTNVMPLDGLLKNNLVLDRSRYRAGERNGPFSMYFYVRRYQTMSCLGIP